MKLITCSLEVQHKEKTMVTIMKKGTRTAEVKDSKLVSMYEDDGWTKHSTAKAEEPVKATLKPVKKFSASSVKVEDSGTAVETPAENNEASNNN
tara:strand:- start:241 stop:522 length:282 start_codon:yes stop_codon:yes gene_type:complete